MTVLHPPEHNDLKQAPCVVHNLSTDLSLSEVERGLEKLSSLLREDLGIEPMEQGP